ncbi:uncharacterized protein [Montipora capricornis]|uniref:uncharacterized protein n=1 Tax=Montipora capricornis TaxID=246305 RepID=UPI0035F16DB6
MDVSKRRRKRKRSQEHTADEFVEVNVPLLAAEEAIDNSQPKGNDRGHANAEGYHGEVLFDPPNPNDVAEQSDESESNGSGFLEASLSPVTNNSTENETQLLDEWLKNDNRDRNLPLDSRDPDFDELWSYVRDDLLDRREDNFEDELISVMDVEDEDVWFNAEEHLQLSDNAGKFCSLPSQCAGNPQQPEKNTPGPKEKTDFDQEPLYKGANVTLGSVMVLLVMFVIRHNLTSEALENLLSIIAALLPASSILPSSVSRFKKYFTNLKHPFVFHHYCSFCFAYISQRGVKQCTNSHCLKDLSAKGATSYFIEIPMVDQLQTMFSRSGFYKDLQHRFNRKKQAQENIEDIYDGRLYRSLVRKGILSSGNNISFIFNTDGVPVFKSSKVSIWPLYLIINELPHHKRFAKENMLFAGMWFGEKKPAMWTFLRPFHESFSKLEQGVNFSVNGIGNVTCQGVLLGGTCDLPARCLVCNAIQYNGASSCWKCLQQGKTVKTGQRGCVRVFPYQMQDPKGPQRTRAETEKNAREALANQLNNKKDYIVHGIKGPSWFGLLEHFDYVAGTGIDYMHGVLLGVQKLLLTLWFSAKFAGKVFSVSGQVSLADKRLSEISPTLEIHRLPRSISEHLKYWKASELRSFLLYYGVPVLYGILPDNYFHHYAIFVHAIYICLKESISSEDLKKAELMLFSFCEDFSSLYDERFITLNVHQLLHLTDDVRDLGPMYTHSCFSFEDKNGFILKLIHGTQFIDSQILSAVSITQKIPELRDKCITSGTDLEAVYFTLSHPRKPAKMLEISKNVYALGAFYNRTLGAEEYAAFQRYLGLAPSTVDVRAFNRLQIGLSGCYVYGLDYKRMLKRNCAAVKYLSQHPNGAANGVQFALVQYFFQVSTNEGDVLNLVMAKTLKLQRDYDDTTHIHVVESHHQELITFPLRDVCCNCIFICFTDNPERGYICEFPNRVEVD